MSIEEREVFRALERCVKGKLYLRPPEGKEFEIGEITPVRRGFGKKRGRPDCVAWVELNMNIVGVRAKAKIPIPVEVEIEGGIGSVKPDYKELFESEGIELPMIVVGGVKRDEKEDYPKTKLKLMITQLPFERIIRMH